MITVDSMIRIPMSDLRSQQVELITASLTYPNPEYLSAKRRGKTRPLKKDAEGKWVPIAQSLVGWVRNGSTLIVPRGTIPMLREHIEPWPGICDRRVHHTPVAFKDGNWSLRPYQEAAAAAMVNQMQGVVVIPAGGGKTYTALAAIARIRQPTLVLVHTLDLLDQWAEEIEEQLGFAPAVLSSRGWGFKAGQEIALCTVQALARIDVMSHLQAVLEGFGCLVLDEAHHAPASTFDRIVNACPAKHRLALTATPDREDGLTQKLYHAFGPILHLTEQRDLLDAGYLVPARIHEVHTDFTFPYRGPEDWQALTDALAKDPARRTQVLDLLEALVADEERVILVLSGRVEDHLVALHEGARERGIAAELLVGKVKKDTRRLIRKGMRAGSVRVIFASTVADEGLNIPELNTLLLTFPAKSEGRVEQRVGRVMRASPGKTHGDVYDFIDSSVIHVGNDSKPLATQYSKRKRAYKTLRATIVKAGQPARRQQMEVDPGRSILRPPSLPQRAPGAPTRYIVGIDPSYTHFGLVAVDLDSWWPVSVTTIETAKSDKKLGLRVADDDTRRLEILLAGLRAFLIQYPPILICCETPSSGAQDANALKGLAYAKALAVAAKVFHQAPTVWLLPGEIKERVGGSLTAAKADLAALVRAVRAADGRSWAEAPWDPAKIRSEHQYDAAAGILAAQNTDLFQMALR